MKFKNVYFKKYKKFTLILIVKLEQDFKSVINELGDKEAVSLECVQTCSSFLQKNWSLWSKKILKLSEKSKIAEVLE